MSVGQALTVCFGMLMAPLVVAQDSDVNRTPGDEEAGLTVSQALEVCKSRGQREYLAKLICPNDAHPEFNRIGSFGTRDAYPGALTMRQADKLLERLMAGESLKPGEPDFHMVDGYEVDCGDSKTTIYLDMYHCEKERPTFAPKGFRLAQ